MLAQKRCFFGSLKMVVSLRFLWIQSHGPDNDFMPIRSDVSAMSDSDVGDQQMLITILTNFQTFVDIPFISTCGRYPVHERFPLSSFSSFSFNHPGQCNRFQLILSHNMTHKSDLPANLQEIP